MGYRFLRIPGNRIIIRRDIKMELNENMKITGHINLKLYDKYGNLKDERDIHNTITTVGKAYLATWLAAASQAGKFMAYLAVGEGSPSGTALGSEIGTRVSGTLSTPGSTNIWQNSGTFAAANGTGAITEVGLFSASTSGTMFASQTFDVINKGASDSLTLTWQITLS